MKNNIKVRDPVCEMNVSPGNFDYKYIGNNYSFCSKQCYDRFIANPHLYIGQPGKPSAKQQGKTILKCRTLKLDRNIPDDISRELQLALNKMMGIKEIVIDNNIIRITYDLLEATAEQIENVISETNEKLSSNWIDKIISAFIHYAEETELDNLEEQHSTHKGHC